MVQPTPTVEPSPTPEGDTITFLVPAYTVRLRPGESVPGTQLTYAGSQDGAYRVTIDGLQATKRTGDSFIWNGVIAPGVYANYNLRLTTSLLGQMPVAGPVEIIIFFPQPQEIADFTAPEESLHFSNIVVTYGVPVGRRVPGTTLVYEGVTESGVGAQGTRLARFSGFSGYPDLAVGDSLIWTGRLRDNVVLRYNLRVLSFGEEGVRLAGTGELWITP